MEAFEVWVKRVETHHQTNGRPLVTLSYAQSLDGSLSARRGKPTTLSGPESSRLTHRLRAAHDAILVGVGTVLADDPRLTVRLAAGENPQPVILDGRLRTPPDSFLLRQHPKSAWIATGQGSDPQKITLLESAGARLLPLPTDPERRIDLASLLDCLGSLGVRRLMVEGGASVITCFLAQRLADQVCITIAPTFLGGLQAVEGSLASSDIFGQVGFPRLANPGHVAAGDDILIWGNLV